MRYAQVCLDVSVAAVGTVLTYSVPEGMVERVQVGTCVAIPLRGRKAIGYVVALSDKPPPLSRGVTVKPILEILSPEPLFDDRLFRLAQRISRYYHCPLDEALRLIIPSGWTRVVERVFRVTEREKAERWLTEKRHQARWLATVLETLLERGGEADYDSLSEALGEPPPSRLSRALSRLKREGLVEEIHVPKTKARRIRPMKAVRLSPQGAQTLRDAKAQSGLTEKQMAVLYRLEEGFAELLPDLVEEGYERGVIQSLVKRGLVEERQFVPDRTWDSDALAFWGPVVTLTDEQKEAVNAIVQGFRETPCPVFLLHGVTASGKTEVYLRVVGEALKSGKGAIVLVPEIALTAQIVGIFRSRFGERVAVWHSALLPSTRFEQWQKVKGGKCPVVVGARSAIFAPVPNLGVIIMDEEHDHSYKQERGIRYHAREVALMRAKSENAVFVMGTATPSLETYYRALKGQWKLLRLTQRVENKPLPRVRVIDERTASHGRSEILSDPLVEAMERALREGEQVILFLNRRGYARIALCDRCEFLFQCPQCSVALVYHAHVDRLCCHHCGHRRPFERHCPQCGGNVIALKGFGTERVEAEVKGLFPGVKVLRLDKDILISRGEHARILNAFRDGEAKVLVGTQMVTKGLDFPGVTVVGVLNADQALLFPHYRAAEECFQLLTQVAGRAGRGEKPGVVFIQTRFPDHYVIRAAIAQDYLGFFTQELLTRKRPPYPPFVRLAEIVTADPDREAARRRIQGVSLAIQKAIVTQDAIATVELLGPAECLIPRLQGKWRYHLLLRSRELKALHSVIDGAFSLLPEEIRGALTVDIDPIRLE